MPLIPIPGFMGGWNYGSIYSICRNTGKGKFVKEREDDISQWLLEASSFYM